MNVRTLLPRRRLRLHASIAVAMGLLLLTLPIAQALTFGSPIRISTNTYTSAYPSVAAYVNYVYVAWHDNTPVTGSGSSYEIWMRVSNNYGASFGSPIRISTNTYDSVGPSLAASGSYVYVAWEDYTPVTGSGTAPEIWMRISKDNGASFGSAVRISTNTGASWNPSVAAADSHVYIAWDDDTPVTGSGGYSEIWMRVSANNGGHFGSAIRISTNTHASLYPSVAVSGSYVYVAWEDGTPVTGSGIDTEIWMRVSSNNGGSFGSPIRISTNAYESDFPSVAASGSYVYVAWADDTPVTGSGGSFEIWMRVSANNGGSFGSAIRVSTNGYGSMLPDVAAFGSYVHVAWMDLTPVTGSGGNYEIWLRVSSNWGASFGSPIRISTNTYDSVGPSVAVNYLYVSYVYVAWEDWTPVSGSGALPEIWLRVGLLSG